MVTDQVLSNGNAGSLRERSVSSRCSCNHEMSLLESLGALLREVGQSDILPFFGSAQPRAKADGSLITEVDLAVQRRLINALEQLAPDIPVLGEEMTQSEQNRLLESASANALTADQIHPQRDFPGHQLINHQVENVVASDGSAFWALDPLDGTSNFTCGFPAFAISLALFRNGEVELGVIHDPVRDETFSALLGQGAWLNGGRLQCRCDCEHLADAMALMDLKRIPPERLSGLLRKGAFRSQRNLGSVALDWCWLAASRAQVYLHGGQRLWDYAAGRLIAAEAGVVTCLLPPGLAQPSQGLSLDARMALAAAHPALFDQWSEHIRLPWQ